MFVCEGEKATDALLEHAIDALGTVTGAKGTPCLKTFDLLRYWDVILWADNDKPGREHMQRIAKALENVAATLKVFAPDLPGKGDDAVEWIEGR